MTILDTIGAAANPPRRRVIVFHYPHGVYGGPFWTWCWEIDGEPVDLVFNLPHFDTWAEAFSAADEALRRRIQGPEPQP